jgi:hypothetical protein
VCTSIEGYLQLKNEVVEVTFEALWKKIKEDNRKVRKINQIVNQTFTPESKHNKILAQWVLNIP